MSKSDNGVYLPGINGLRFFAAAFVIVAHTEMFKSIYGLPNFFKISEVLNLGGLGVYFFFVLSGYLITYLMIEEAGKFGKINLKAFYTRRILRIWPLYYLIMALGFFVFPYIEFLEVGYLTKSFERHSSDNFWFYLFMSPNIAFSFMQAVPHIGQAWSIGVEEQFYIFWPLIFRNLKNKLKSMILLFASIVLIKVVFVLLLNVDVIPSTEFTEGLKRLLGMSKFESMIIGAIGAVLVKNYGVFVRKTISKMGLFLLSILLVPLIKVILPTSLDDVYHLVGSVSFVIIIINVSIFKRMERMLEFNPLTYLGKISYGLYMYHMVISLFFVKLFVLVNAKSIFSGLLLYFLIFGSTIIISSLSYSFFEKPFLKLKGKYSIIKSGRS